MMILGFPGRSGFSRCAGPRCARCVKVKRFPAIVTVPVRRAAARLGAAVSDTEALPLPPLELTVIQLAAVVAVQSHPVVVATETDDPPPSASTNALVGETL
jgi:hypothetical protein